MFRILTFALIAFAFQAQAAVISFNPSTSTVNQGDIFSIGVEGSGFASSLDGGGVNLSFNPAVLELLDVSIDTSVWDFFVDKGTIDNVAGTVKETQFNQFVHPQVGSFSILEYQFRAKNLGVSELVLTEFSGNPFGSGGIAIGPDFTEGFITVVPEPSALFLLLLAGLALLVAYPMRGRQTGSV